MLSVVFQFLFVDEWKFYLKRKRKRKDISLFSSCKWIPWVCLVTQVQSKAWPFLINSIYIYTLLSHLLLFFNINSRTNYLGICLLCKRTSEFRKSDSILDFLFPFFFSFFFGSFFHSFWLSNIDAVSPIRLGDLAVRSDESVGRRRDLEST